MTASCPFPSLSCASDAAESAPLGARGAWYQPLIDMRALPSLAVTSCTEWYDTPGVTTNIAMEFQKGGRSAEGATEGGGRAAVSPPPATAASKATITPF